MIIAQVIFALIVGFVMTLIFAIGLRRRGPWGNLFIFFLLVFLVTWAGGIWVSPFGPDLWGVYWLPFFIIGLLSSLLLSSAGHALPPRTPQEAVEEAEVEVAVHSILNIFLWLLIVGIIALIVFYYYNFSD